MLWSGGEAIGGGAQRLTTQTFGGENNVLSNGVRSVRPLRSDSMLMNTIAPGSLEIIAHRFRAPILAGRSMRRLSSSTVSGPLASIARRTAAAVSLPVARLAVVRWPYDQVGYSASC